MTTKANDNPPSLTFQNTEIKEVISHKHGGLMFFSDLKWTHHIYEVKTKVNKKLKLLKKFKFNLDHKPLFLCLS